MLKVCALSLLIFHFGNAATIPTTEHEFELKPSYESNKTLVRTNFDDSIVIQSRATVDANGCHKCSRTYLIGKEGVTFNQAVFLCNQIGMEIASITSAQEEEEIEKAAFASAPGHRLLWIGGKRCSGCLSEFIWISSGKPVVYRHFKADQPDNTKNSEDCLQIVQLDNVKGSYGWNDMTCNSKIGFVCQSRCCCNNN